MILRNTEYVKNNTGITKRFALFPKQLGEFDIYGCTKADKRIWLEWYYEEWIVHESYFGLDKQITKKFQK